MTSSLIHRELPMRCLSQWRQLLRVGSAEMSLSIMLASLGGEDRSKQSQNIVQL